ncbi:MAG: MATE family efflux transporter [Paracoccaceae bacterium]
MAEARFTTGSTMRHVAVMTATGAVGLMALFLVDAVNLFYISLLGQEALAAAVGFAGTLQFFLISVSIGLAIAAGAVVSRRLGAGDEQGAREAAGSALIVRVAVLAVVAALALVWRAELLAALGATGRVQDLAARYLTIVLPAVPLLGVGMVAGGLLRAVGDGARAMWVTLAGGIVAAALDPVFIFALGLGLDGAAIVSVFSRLVLAGLGLWFVTRRHGLLGWPAPARFVPDARALLAVAGPAVLTQLSTPFGNAYLTRTVAEHGAEAVAGWAVVGRVAAVAFGGLFALSGAIGPILGQNLGAGRPGRIRAAYRDALLFVAAYVAVVWAALWLATPWLVAGFGVQGAGAEVVSAFTLYGAGAWLFAGWLFVSNAACNNLGRPLWSTGFNWTRDALAIPLAAAALGTGVVGGLGAEGAVAAQALAGVAVGLVAVAATRRFLLGRLEHVGEDEPQPPALAPFASGRAALAGGPPALPRADPPTRS